jgi:hypothetical protein
MAIDVNGLAQQMLSTALPILKPDAPNVEPFAGVEFTKLAHTIAGTAQQIAAGQISEQEGVILLEMQKSTARAALLGLKGLSLLTVENAINAAFGAARASTAGTMAIVGPWPP